MKPITVYTGTYIDTGSQSLPTCRIQYERAFSRRTIIIIMKVQVYSDAVPILIVFLNKQQTCRKPTLACICYYKCTLYETHSETDY